MSHGAVTRILAIRHGETAWNVDTRIQGHLDIGLNTKGRWQAQQAALALAGESIHPTAVFVGPVARDSDCRPGGHVVR